MYSEDEIVRPSPGKRASESKLRRDGQHCPICLIALGKNARRTRQSRKCHSCQAQMVEGKRCQKCAGESVWENRNGAACQKCGLHGAKSDVIN